MNVQSITSRFEGKPRAIAAVAKIALTALSFGLPSLAWADALDHWTQRSAPAGGPTIYNTATYGQNKFVAVGDLGRVITSANGVDWQTVQTPTQQFLISVAYGNGLFVAVGESMSLLTSPDGQTWTKRSEGTNAGNLFYEVIFTDGSFFASANNGHVRRSDDGINWTNINLPTQDFYARSLTRGEGVIVVVGETENYTARIYTSPNGNGWTPRDPKMQEEISSVAYGAGRFVAMGKGGQVSTSEDGATWTARGPLKNVYMWNVVYVNNQFVAAGDQGTLYTSPDGITWTQRNTGSTSSFDGIAFNGDTVIVVGSNKTILQSDSIATPNPQPQPEPGDPSASRLQNLSARAFVGTAQNELVGGFAITGSAQQQVLVRAVGPSLAQFGVPGVLDNPRLIVYDAAGKQVAANDDWSNQPNSAQVSQRASEVGAFALPANSKDAAMVLTLSPGAYTVNIAGVGGQTGISLAEVYPIQPPEGNRLINLSSRSWVGSGAQQSISGFVIGGNAPRQLLIRGVGPGLTPFGVGGVLANPQLKVVDASGAIIASNDNWQQNANVAELTQAFAKVGAFGLTAGSLDSALLVTLPPGAYTAMISDVTNGTGVALVEVYEVK